MSLSYVIRFPDLDKLCIPEKLRIIPIGDDKIFCDLKNQHRRVEEKEGPAEKGDYALVEMTDAKGTSRMRHVELGRNFFPDLEAALLGSRKGQKRKAEVNGENLLIEVHNVGKVTELALTDDVIKGLAIPNVSSLSDYRQKYIREHGPEIEGRIFHTLQAGLLDQTVRLMELSLDQEELDRFHNRQRMMLQNLSGDADRRLLDAYGPKGGKSVEECNRLFYEDNKRTYSVSLWGRALAERNGVVPDEKETKQAIDSFCMIHDKTEQQVEEEGLKEEALRSFYLQYGIRALEAHYQAMVRFSAKEIPSQPLLEEIPV